MDQLLNEIPTFFAESKILVLGDLRVGLRKTTSIDLRSARLRCGPIAEADDRPAQKLELRVIDPPAPIIENLLVMLTMQTAGVLPAGYPKVAL